MENKEKIVKLLQEIDIAISVKDIEDITSFDDLTEYLQDNSFFDVEIIYNSAAMEYLTEHDNSLRDSIGLASDMGYKTEDLNSELLASLLASENLKEEYYELEDEITELFDSEL